MRSSILLLILLTLCQLNLQAQSGIKEEVFLHVSSNLLVTGETLYFSAHCLTEHKSASPLSKVLYVELVGENGSVHQQKVALENGRGYGDIFLSSLVSSGKYQLLAYTRWMKNFNDYFQVPITIINPFETYPDISQPELNISFYPKYEKLLVETENQIGFHIEGLRESNFNGKIVNDLGETVTTFTHDILGLGSFTLLPKEGRSYQAILEDETSKIHFFELPEIVTNKTKQDNPELVSHSISVKKKNTLSTYGIRESVTISEDLLPGNYSISVKRKNESLPNVYTHAVASKIRVSIETSPVDVDTYFSLMENPSIETFLATCSFKQQVPIPKTVSILPEVREELITGKLIDKEGNGVENEAVMLSILSDPFQLRSTITGKDGVFTVPFESCSKAEIGYLYPYELDANYQVTYEDPFLREYPEFNYHLPYLDSMQVMELAQRSVRVQLENAYFEPSESYSKQIWVEHIPYDLTYVLDDYVRFRTIKETFTEFIATASVREKRDPIFKAIVTLVPLFKQKEPLVLLDGVMVPQKKLLEHSPYKIESVSILNNRYFMGPLVYDGVIALKSKEKVLNGFDLGSNYQSVPISPLVKDKNYAFKAYPEDSSSRIPDQRDQLYWNPSLQVNSEKMTEISFYTSDVTGRYDVVIEGFTSEGEPVSKVITFNVIKKES